MFDSDDRIVVRRRMAGWLPAAAAASLISVLTLAAAVGAIAVLMTGKLQMASVLGVLAAWLLVLSGYVWRDSLAKRDWSIGLEAGQLFLRLPAGRSITAWLQPEHIDIETRDVSSIDTRLEAFRSVGLSALHRSYALRLKSGRVIVLGEDRALATDLGDETIGQMIDVIALKTGLPVCDLGMIEGKGGLFGLVFTSVPGWSEPDMPARRQRRIWRGAELTFALAGLVTAGALALSFTT